MNEFKVFFVLLNPVVKSVPEMVMMLESRSLLGVQGLTQ